MIPLDADKLRNYYVCTVQVPRQDSQSQQKNITIHVTRSSIIKNPLEMQMIVKIFTDDFLSLCLMLQRSRHSFLYSKQLKGRHRVESRAGHKDWEEESGMII